MGAVQGLTEFLPVSSSGHLVVLQSLIPGFSQPGVLFDVVLHAGTLFAVIWFYRRLLFRMSRTYLYLLFIGTIPAVIVGIIFSGIIESLFSYPKLVGLAFLLTAYVNLRTDATKTVKAKINIGDAFYVGLFQAVAIVPGISRSGSTIFAGARRKIAKSHAAEFSFLLSIPAIIGANLVEILGHGASSTVDIVTYLAGFVSAAIVGYFAIGWTVKALVKSRFSYFGIYTAVLGVLVVLFL